MIGHIIFVASIAISIACLAYSVMARSMGWPIGEILARDGSVPTVVALLTLVWAVGKSFFTFYWWSPVAVLIAGFFLAFIMTMLLRKHTQVVAVAGVFPALFITILYISETKPLGMFHRLIG